MFILLSTIFVLAGCSGKCEPKIKYVYKVTFVDKVVKCTTPNVVCPPFSEDDAVAALQLKACAKKYKASSEACK